MREVMFKPFQAATGIRVKDDGPPEAVKVKAQADTGKIMWDILDTDIPAILTMAKNDLLEEIDYSKLDASRLASIPKVLHHQFGLGHLIYGFNIVYDTKTFPTGKHPQCGRTCGMGRRSRAAARSHFEAASRHSSSLL
jgi:putative spermidine/putrescine transport system substrate-binding protein